MKKLIVFIAVVALLSLVGCVQRYYLKNNLNQITIGQTKEKTLAMFPGERSAAGAPGMEIRAAQRSINGKLLEVGEGRVPGMPY